jgi:hypothetical protein
MYGRITVELELKFLCGHEWLAGKGMLAGRGEGIIFRRVFRWHLFVR